MRTSILLLANHASSAGEARRVALRLAEELGLEEEDCGRLAVVVSEGVSNLVKHAREGELFIGPGADDESVEMLFCDKGPGMSDIPRCFSDGYSTAGTMGSGLGAMRRLSDFFHVHSRPGEGTLISSTIVKRSRLEAAVPLLLDIAAHAIPYPGEDECGDAIGIQQIDRRIGICVVDGLGHGPEAAVAAKACTEIFMASPDRSPADILQLCHQAIMHTRGVAIAVAVLDRGQIIHCGVGNISCSIVGDGPSQQHLLSHDGIVGYTARRFHEKSYAWNASSRLVMYSDGIINRCSLPHFADAGRQNVRLSAAYLLRDCRRGRDDTAVVVASERKV